MKISILLTLSLVLAVRSHVGVRWPPVKLCSDGNCDETDVWDDEPVGDCDEECCEDPCPKCLDDLDVTREECTPVVTQEMSQNTVLVCDYPESQPIARIEYNGCYECDTTCTGVLPASENNDDGIYTLVLRDSDGDERRVDINGDYNWVSIYNQGSLLYYEESKLKGCECAGATLKGFYALTPDRPLTDCCTNGTTHLTADYGIVQLYSSDPKCCATCRLQQSSIVYNEQAVTNE